MNAEESNPVADVIPTQQEPESPVPNPETSEPDKVFDLAYVTKLRQEAADARVKAKRSDALASQLVRAIVELDGRLIDADDLPFSGDLLDEDGSPDRAKIASAIEALIERKPHLAVRRPTMQVAQGARPEPEPVNLLQLLKANT